MKTNLKGLLRNAGAHCEQADKTYGAIYAYSLLELGDHIRGLLRGEHSAEEFAKHYSVDLADKEPWADPWAARRRRRLIDEQRHRDHFVDATDMVGRQCHQYDGRPAPPPDYRPAGNDT